MKLFLLLLVAIVQILTVVVGHFIHSNVHDLRKRGADYDVSAEYEYNITGESSYDDLYNHYYGDNREERGILINAALRILTIFGVYDLGGLNAGKVYEKPINKIITPPVAKYKGPKPGEKICNTRREDKVGVCEAKGTCLANGGVAAGQCSNCLGCATCCQYTKTCQATTSELVSYWESEGYPETRRDETFCQLTVKVRQDVTQIRLDFFDFELPGPINGECRDTDNFAIINNLHPVGVLGNGQSKLCGLNSDQHLYMEADPDQLVVLKVITSGVAPVPFAAPFPENPGINVLAGDTGYRWRIKVTQIMGNSDYDYMQKISAPTGCRQYFTSRKGSLVSFNWDGRAQMLNKQDYTVCIRSPDRTCGITLSALSFGIRTSPSCRDGSAIDEDGTLCCSKGESFFGLIGARVLTEDTELAGKYHYCGNNFGTIQAKYKGPLNFRVMTGDVIHFNEAPPPPIYDEDSYHEVAPLPTPVPDGDLACKNPRDCAGFRLAYDVQTGTC